MSYSFIEQLAKDIAEIRGEEANPADYLPNDVSDDTDDEKANSRRGATKVRPSINS